jgi:CDP-paratose 2-epimerase
MQRKMIVTGGAGFIGYHAAVHYARAGWHVTVFDDLSRRGSGINFDALGELPNVDRIRGDVRSRDDLAKAFRAVGEVDAVLHLAAQVAVTTSVVDPRHDFDVNAFGTFNTLEATREHAPGASFVYASTNKVYGGLEHHHVVERDGRWDFADLSLGVSEAEPLDFHSPYGCSKGSADQYVRDYSRIYGLRSFVVRQSCIYGTHQFGVEDQGWVAWFAIAAVLGLPTSIYGDGKQVRDLLWVEDLLALYDACIERGEPGAIYNAGGGPANRCSILELVDMLGDILGRDVSYEMSDWRPGDQRVFYSDNAKAAGELGWRPCVGVQEGVHQLTSWVRENADAIRTARAS